MLYTKCAHTRAHAHTKHILKCDVGRSLLFRTAKSRPMKKKRGRIPFGYLTLIPDPARYTLEIMCIICLLPVTPEDAMIHFLDVSGAMLMLSDFKIDTNSDLI